MSVRLLTACLTVSALLLLGSSRTLAKPPDLPNCPTITCEEPKNEAAPQSPAVNPTPPAPRNPLGVSGIRCLRLGIYPLFGLLSNLDLDVEFQINFYEDNPIRRMNQLLIQSEDLRQIEYEVERIMFVDQPSHLTPERVHGGIGDGPQAPTPPDTTCPYLKEKAACEKAAAVKRHTMPGDVLSNLENLEKAEDLYRKGLFHQKNGREREAVRCFETVRRLCPGSRYDTMASEELLRMAGLKTVPADASEEQEPPKAPAIEERLEKPVSVNYLDTPLGVVLDDLRAVHSVNIVVDKPRLDADGCSLDAPVTLKLEHVAMKTVLRMALAHVGLAYKVENEVVVVTTHSGAAGKPVTRTYSVAELIGKGKKDAGNAKKLIKLIQTISPHSWADSPHTWTEVGACGTIEYFPMGQSVVVSQTPDVHEQISHLLEALLAFKGRNAIGGAEESEPKRPARTKPRPVSSSRKKVSQLLEQCHDALKAGRHAEAAALAQKAESLDADAVAADPFVYKMGLLDQARQKTVQTNKAFIEPPLPKADPNTVPALDRLLVETTEPEVKLFVNDPGTLTLKSDQSDAAKFAEAFESARGALFDRLMTAVCVEVDHTQGPTRGRINLMVGGVHVRAAWDAQGHGSVSFGLLGPVPDGGLVQMVEWVGSLADAVLGGEKH